jgi:hypothetical protein
MVDAEQTFKIDMLFGHCESRAWLEFDGERLIGMGSKKTFDRDGKLIAYSESPTGVTMTLLGERPSRWRRAWRRSTEVKGDNT